jgi:hypothetical protein
MSNRFHDRLTDTAHERPPEKPLLGRWQCDPGPQGGTLNTFSPAPATFLVPDGDHRWSWVAGGEPEPAAGAFDRLDVPDEVTRAAVADLGGLLGHLEGGGRTWLGWLEVPPVCTGFSERIQVQPLERHILEHLPHLQEVCRRPRMHLEVTVEKVRVEKARRVPPRAVEYLTAHTEDWEELKVRSVRPRKILSVLAEDKLDIYENRVVARLIDHLLTHVHRRIDVVERLKRHYEEVASFNDPASEATHWIRSRIYTLWGEFTEAEQGRRRAEQTLAVLEALRRELSGLLDSPLYRAVPRRAHIPASLRTTNILVNDQHYRHVARLWRLWARNQLARAATPRQVFDEYQHLCGSFDAFAMLLASRALGDLGFLPGEDRAPTRGGPPLELEADWGVVQVSWRNDGTIRLDGAGHDQPLIIVPLVAALSSGGADRVRERLRELSPPVATPRADARRGEPKRGAARQAGHGDCLRVVFYPGTAAERERLPADLGRTLNTLGNDRLPAEREGAGVLPVSPLSIESLERVARVIRWWLFDSLLCSYPPGTVACPGGVRQCGELPGDWVRWDEGGTGLRVVRPPRPPERERWREWLTRVRQHFQRQGARATVPQSRLDAVESGIENAVGQLQPLARCPLGFCRAGTSVEQFAPRKDREQELTLFAASCEHAEWELRQCELCGGRYPVLLPKGFTQREVERLPGWVDRLLGRDVLAIPCWAVHGQGSFICPRCGGCKNTGRAEAGACLRCGREGCSR